MICMPNSPRFVMLLAIFAFHSLLETNLCCGQWDRFRGANGSGSVELCTVPLPWSTGDIAWKIALPGKGNGSPIVVGKRIFIMSAEPGDAERHALAYDLSSGKELWRKSYDSQRHKLHARSSYASCTPCADEHAVYFAWATPENFLVKCYSHEGEERWSKEFGRYVSAHGFGGSPVLVDNKLIIANSQDAEELPEGVAPGESSIVALDAKTGDLIWKTPRTSVRTCYGTPTVFTAEDGKLALLFNETGDGMFAIDVATGKQLWNKKVFTKRCVSCPVIVGDRAFGTEGSGGGGNVLFGVDLKGDHDLVLEVKRAAPYVPTPVAKGQLLFLWSDNGIVSCVDALTGESHWSERIGGNVSTSPVIAGDKVIGIAEDGTVTVLAASTTFKNLGQVKIAETIRSTPLVAKDYLLIRTDSNLFCIGKPL